MSPTKQPTFFDFTRNDQLCAPPSGSFSSLDRKSSSYDRLPDLADKLVIKDRLFRQQYASIYFVRLHKLRPIVKAAAEQRWADLPDHPQYVPKVLDVTETRCYIIGTIYVDMALKPNILNDLSAESSIVAPPLPKKYKGSDDKIAIEDESGRIQLVGAAVSQEFWVTGMVVGLLGRETSTGEFEIQEVCLPGIPPQPSIPKSISSEKKYVAIVSGLNIGSDASLDLKTQLLTEFLSGELGSPVEQVSSADICRVILAGNSIARKKIVEDTKKPRKYGYDSTRYDATPMLQLDELLEEICGTVPVDVMPGAQDPVNRHLPQQKLNMALFQRARRLKTLQTVTNPYWAKIDDVVFLGTAGQNVDDLYKYTDSENRLAVAERCLFWRHTAPSAPDTLWCYPFQDRDPFLLEQSPHVYFIGNQSQFEQSLIEGPEGQKVRVILVPSFSETGMIVLVDLSTLECTTVRFADDQNSQSSVIPMDTSE